MYCRKCGKELKPGARFCSGCGESVSRIEGQNAANGPLKKDNKQKYKSPGMNEIQGNENTLSVSGVLIVAGIVLLIAIVGCAVAFGFFTLHDSEPKKPDAVEDTFPGEKGSLDHEDDTVSNDQGTKKDTSSTKDDESTSLSGNNATDNSHSGQNGSSEPPQANNQSSEYLWPTDKEYIRYSDLSGRGKDEVAAIRNEIFARHGYAFQKPKWQEYFAKKSWYHRDSSCTESVVMTKMNSIEKANIDTIVQYEKDMGWR